MYSSQFVIIITMNCACVVFKISGTWNKIGRRKDTFLHHSVLPLFLSLHLLPLLYLEILQPHNLPILLIQVLGNHCKNKNTVTICCSWRSINHVGFLGPIIHCWVAFRNNEHNTNSHLLLLPHKDRLNYAAKLHC